MELQDAIIVGLAIAALIVSILSIIFGIIVFRMQIQQARSMMKDSADFAQDMKTLINEIRISQDATGQQVKDQYDKLLDAALRGGASQVDAAASSAVEFGELIKRFQTLEKAVAELKEPEKIQHEISGLKKSIEIISTTVKDLVRGVTIEEKRYTSPASSRFQKFTQWSRRALSEALQETQRLNHSQIGPEHILLGLTRGTGSTAVEVLTNLGVDLDSMRSAIEFSLPKTEELMIHEKQDIGLAPQGKKVIEFAIDEARLLKHHYVGSEHILLGILVEDGLAAGILKGLNVTLEKARSMVKKMPPRKH